MGLGESVLRGYLLDYKSEERRGLGEGRSTSLLVYPEDTRNNRPTAMGFPYGVESFWKDYEEEKEREKEEIERYDSRDPYREKDKEKGEDRTWELFLALTGQTQTTL
ncbi:P-loop containing nucleoside triphosphatehydrolases superfamily protein [Striga asiatica]|uniref:P-loop containing nucleoside triphosphatehydrolases superfamily protein n=1 Tax=Striga asiatica TaxID=4170 RepID=A0A5A7QEA2_STRAF|nr:P-loop containing nucleoside triphosphatehydrolases superfamily protein [Striga asiatica]